MFYPDWNQPTSVMLSLLFAIFDQKLGCIPYRNKFNGDYLKEETVLLCEVDDVYFYYAGPTVKISHFEHKPLETARAITVVSHKNVVHTITPFSHLINVGTLKVTIELEQVR